MNVLSRGNAPQRRGVSSLLALAVALSMLAVAMAWFWQSSVPVEPRRKPNVILITIDTLRADRMGCYGYAYNTTPFLDSLAAGGFLFENAHSSSATTASSHASIFTSLDVAQHGVLKNGRVLNDSVYTAADMFREQGYVSAGFAAVALLQHMGGGFDTLTFNHPSFNKWYTPADYQLEQVLEWLSNGRNMDRPYFLWVHFYDVHESDLYYRTLNGSSEILRPIQLLTDEDWSDYGRYLTEARGLPDSATNRSILERQHIYDEKIRFVDENIRLLFQAVDGAGEMDDTIWVVTSDHGEGLGNHGYMTHEMYLYEEQLHVPLMVYYPRMNPAMGGIRFQQPVSGLDILPTLAQAAGLTLGNHTMSLRGRSLMPLMTDPKDDFPPAYSYAQRTIPDKHRESIGWEQSPIFSLQDRRYKYIHHTQRGDELYDLLNDPFEADNLAGRNFTIEKTLRNAALRRYEAGDEERSRFIPNDNTPLKEETIAELRALGYV